MLSTLARGGESAPAKRFLPSLARGETLATLTIPTLDPHAGVGSRSAGSDPTLNPAASTRPAGTDPTLDPHAGCGQAFRRAMGVPPDGVWGRVGTTHDGAAPVGTAGTGSLGPAGAPSVVPTRSAPAEQLPTTGVGAVAAGRRATTEGLALDADAADVVLVVRGDELWLAPGHHDVHASTDPARRLARPTPGGELLAAGPAVREAAAHAHDWAMLATAAQALGVGLALLDRTVAYAKQRRQFGTEIGSFQAVKHRLADTLLALEFARPLLFGAALTLDSADLAAAKVTAGEAAYAAARTALQIHGAVGYTEELDLSLWLRKARPLRDAWGTPAWCRARVIEAYGGS
ncbi:acyl-CoA dehydrogenase family protein [Streptomyces sp. NPDC059885]|uniref:acyl-CoA dehydrogenase family protein n=1 Tax=Streptomyces sp. NPDC059885 TaxID=3346988 RepID=UPI003648EC7B